MTTAKLTAPSLIAEAERLLAAHIYEHVTQVLIEAMRHYPAILRHFSYPATERPEGVPEWIYSAVFEATNEFDELCWPIFRGSLMSRAYSFANGCRTSGASLELKTAMSELGAARSSDGDPSDETSWVECLAITGTGLAKALGVSLYQRLREAFKAIEDSTRNTLAGALGQPLWEDQ